MHSHRSNASASNSSPPPLLRGGGGGSALGSSTRAGGMMAYMRMKLALAFCETGVRKGQFHPQPPRPY